jgi:hypothetical protein
MTNEHEIFAAKVKLAGVVILLITLAVLRGCAGVAS